MNIIFLTLLYCYRNICLLSEYMMVTGLSEGWNHRFSNLVGRHLPSLYVLITKIRLEVASNKAKLAQYSLGTLTQNKKKFISK